MEFGFYMIPKRVVLISASGLKTIYKKRGKRLTVESFNQCAYIHPGMFEALEKLNKIVELTKGHMHIIDLLRTWEMQSLARDNYEAGKKTAYVAKPGSSFHQSGMAVDIAVSDLGFKDSKKEDWLEIFWVLAKPLGFKPIISIPDITANESWHFDWIPEEWEEVYNRLSYKEAAKATILDVGCWNPDEDPEKLRKMFIQSQLIRLGYFETGKIDGIFGPKTHNVLEYLGLKDFDTLTLSQILSKRNK